MPAYMDNLHPIPTRDDFGKIHI